jgi:hypothetical protein
MGSVPFSNLCQPGKIFLYAPIRIRTARRFESNHPGLVTRETDRFDRAGTDKMFRIL